MMKKLLHIIATPRGEDSRTLRMSSAFLEAFVAANPEWILDELDLAHEELPSLTMKRVDGKYVLLAGKDLYGDLKEAWQEILSHIERFLSADAYLLSTPMWNFSIPYVLKHYIDVIVQPNYLFRYTQDGAEGFAKKRKMVVITSRGREYLSEETKPYDLQQSYLRTIFGFIGITDIEFVVAQPMDMGDDIREQKLTEACRAARDLGHRFLGISEK